MSNSNARERFFMDTVHADVVFVVGYEEIPGHRAAFATSCPYFDKLLNGDFKESESVKVEITGTSAQVFKEVKRYIYLGRLETTDWTINDMVGALATAHEYQYQDLITEVVKILALQPLDFDSWTLVNSAAALYDSAPLKAICVSFAEAELDNFLGLKNMEKMTEEFICFMFDTPKIRAVNQDQLLSSLLQWKNSHCSAQIRSFFEKICWSEVSQNIAALISKLFLINLQNEDEVQFWNQLVHEVHVQSHCIASVDHILLKKKPLEYGMRKQETLMYCYHVANYIQIYFMKNGISIEIPVKEIHFELPNEHRIRKVDGRRIITGHKEMFTELLAENNDWLKYSATNSEAEPISCIRIYSDKFGEASEITLRSLVIY